MDIYSLEQNLKCPICWTIPEVPYESSCCGHIFCVACTEQITSKKCPLCRCHDITFRKNTFAKKLLNEIKIICSYGCDKFITINRMKEHRYDCDKAVFDCSLPSCNFKGTKNEAMKHLISDHSLHLLVLAENFNKIQTNFEKFEVSNSSIKLNTNSNMQELNKKMNNYKSEISEFFSESYFDELI